MFHPAGRALTSDSSGNSLIMVVYQKFLVTLLTENSDWSLKQFLQTTIIKLFTDQSEVSALSVGSVFTVYRQS